jgi:hypothetical protein
LPINDLMIQRKIKVDANVYQQFLDTDLRQKVVA